MRTEKFKQPYNNESNVISVTILDSDKNKIYDIVASGSQTNTVSGQIQLDFITITQSLNGHIEGYLIFDGSKNEFELLQGRGDEYLQIQLAEPISNEKEEENNIKLPVFSIVSIDDVSNVTDLEKTPEGNKIRKIKITFCSEEVRNIYTNKPTLPIGFIGRISTGMTGENSGLVELLNEEYFGNNIKDIEPTSNYVWVHPNMFSFPSRKDLTSMNSVRLLNYCKMYAIPKGKPNVANYCFWHDFDGWHFKSIDSLIKEQVTVDEDGENEIKKFSISGNIADPNRIYSFDVIKDYSEHVSFSDGSLFSYYTRIDPDYGNVYHRLMGDREKYKRKAIKYNYKDYSSTWEKLESTSLVEDYTKEEIEKIGKIEEYRGTDILYGWYDNRGFHDQDVVNNFILLGDEASGLSGGTGNSGPSADAQQSDFGYSDYSGYEPIMFQSMFDCTDASGELQKTILEKIKQPAFENKKKYREKLSEKEKFNIYKYSVCCDFTEPEELTYVMLTGHHKISNNIYRYSWKEVAIVPKAEFGNFLGIGITADDVPGYPGGITTERGFYSATVEQLNQIRLPENSENSEVEPTRPMNYRFIKFPSNSDKRAEVNISTVRDLSGEFLILPPENPEEQVFNFTNKVTEQIAKYFTGNNPTGLTLTFHNNVYSPWLIVEKPDGAQGVTYNPSGAYNLNEIMNKTIYNENDFPSVTGDTILYYQGVTTENARLLPLQEPSSEKDIDVIIGPGINGSENYTDYPAGFDMLPIGGYKQVLRTINDSGEEIVVTYPDADNKELQCKAIPMGHIVKMGTISYKELPKYGVDTRKYATRQDKKIFYFSATNAHDGTCNGACKL